MNRRHTSDVYLAVIDKLRAFRPDIAMSGILLLAFPAKPITISLRRYACKKSWLCICLFF